jgi:hypothetical protein
MGVKNPYIYLYYKLIYHYIPAFYLWADETKQAHEHIHDHPVPLDVLTPSSAAEVSNGGGGESITENARMRFEIFYNKF